GTAGASGSGLSQIISYTPIADTNGSDSFVVQVSDGSLTDTIIVSVTIQAVNDAPVAENDAYATGYDATLVVAAANGVLDNDTDVENDPLTAMLDSGPSNGALSLNLDGSFTYTPTAGFSGLDSFTYHASDGADDSSVTAVTINVDLVPIYTLTTIISPTAGGAVALDPSGGVYAENTVVTMTAVPASGYKFVAWSDDLPSTLNPVTITMMQDVTVTANFDQAGFAIYLPLIVKNPN
ncbi:MAG: tandem-95 repeat protein, partial [Chloroflexi bacterium]|nr:tandem-95 repeat protein [Chloroflexota bacterium]